MKDVWSFRLYPDEHSKLYCEVNVWRTRALYVTHCKRKGYNSNRAVATASPIHITIYEKGKVVRINPVFCELNFYQSRLGSEVVSHEVFHAAMAWGRRLKFPFEKLGDIETCVNDHEECLTYGFGRMYSQFVSRAYDLGIYK